MNTAIGGYFELEPAAREGRGYPHQAAAHLNTGRNALEYIFATLGPIRKVYIPYFTCDVVLEPFEKLRVPYERYRINRDLELAEPLALADGEYLLYTNYYGIKDAYVRELYACHGSRLIVDNAQALLMPPIPGCMMAYSPRKFIGTADGGLAYPDVREITPQFPEDSSAGRMDHLYLRKQYGPQAGYAAFKENSSKLAGQPVRRMSPETRETISHIDFDALKAARRDNFSRLHAALARSNRLNIPDMSAFAAPLVYPYYTDDTALKSQLISEQVFVATYWPNVFDWCQPGDEEYKLAEHIVCLPIDQRYRGEDMDRILSLIQG